ncbi:MAG: hypothetical protein KDI19_10525 [Pseudomonadales bacterium]|nr:hypothetical protein [Pseudomonadales bacterium]
MVSPLDKHFCQLIRAVNPQWKRKQCEDTAYQILTMVMGAWITLGQTRVLREDRRADRLKNQLVSGVAKLLA